MTLQAKINYAKANGEEDSLHFGTAVNKTDKALREAL